MSKMKRILAVVMMLVLIAGTVSTLPAKAATAEPKLNYSSKTVYVDGSKVRKAFAKGSFTLKVKNKPAKYSVTWSSDDESVAKVDKLKSGKATVTAVKPGTATVTARVVNSKTKEVYKLKCKVTVKKNAAAVSITPASVDKMVVDDSLDLTATMYNKNATVAEAGKDVTDYVLWKSSNPDVATVTTDGTVDAWEAGETVITCYTAQAKTGTYSRLSKATAKAEIVIKVVDPDIRGIESVSQKTLNSFVVNMGSDFSKNFTTANLSVTSQKSVIPVKSLSFDETGKQLTVVSEVDFADGQVVDIELKDTAATVNKTASFTASKGNPVRMEVYTEMGDSRVIAARETKLFFRIFNSKGVDITPATDSAEYTVLANKITVKAIDTGSWYIDNSKKTIYISESGKSVSVLASFTDYYVENAKAVENSFNAAFVALSVTEGATMSFNPETDAMVSSSASLGAALDWSKPVRELSVSDASGSRLVVRIKDYAGNYIYSDAADSKITFATTRSDNNYAMFINSNGAISPIQTGTEIVSVKYNDNLIGTVTVNVLAKRAVSRMSFVLNGEEVNTAIVSSASGLGSLDVTVKLYDQTGALIPVTADNLGLATNLTVAYAGAGTNKHPSALVYANADKTGSLRLNGAGYGSTAGTAYVYRLTFTDSAYGTLSEDFNVIVYTPDSNVSSTYSVEISGTTDLTLASEITFLPYISITLYEMKGDVKYKKVSNLYSPTATCPNDAFFYKLTAPNGAEVTTGLSSNMISPVWISGSSIVKYSSGKYTLTVYKKVGTGSVQVATTSFTLTDTHNSATVEAKNPAQATPITTIALKADMTEANKILAFLECFNAKIGDKQVTSAEISAIDAVATDGILFIRNVTVFESVKYGENVYKIPYNVTVDLPVKNV